MLINISQNSTIYLNDGSQMLFRFLNTAVFGIFYLFFQKIFFFPFRIIVLLKFKFLTMCRYPEYNSEFYNLFSDLKKVKDLLRLA